MQHRDLTSNTSNSIIHKNHAKADPTAPHTTDYRESRPQHLDFTAAISNVMMRKNRTEADLTQ